MNACLSGKVFDRRLKKKVSEFSFEVKYKDIAGRIGALTVNGRKIETPALMPVVNVNKPVITVEELAGEFGAGALMTNAYILLKSEELKARALSEGIHRLLGYDGIVATDSGSYQLMVYGSVTTTNREIIEFQENIGSDIGSFLDIPTLPDAFKPRAEEQLRETLARSREAINAKFAVNAGIQGGKYLDLRAQAAREIGESFDLVAVGGIVPLMESYRYRELADIILTVKENMPLNRVVHAFGLGHPMVFGLAVAMGCDLFDSAAYSLYAQNDRYLTVEGTKRLSELEYVPCSCPVCSRHGIRLKELNGDERVRMLARHNLYVTMEEIRTVKQAIRENSLWELIAMRCRAHPKLLDGFNSMVEHSGWLANLDLISKKSAFYITGPESEKRTEVLNARSRMKRVSSSCPVELPVFGEVPAELLDIYPFNSLVEDYGKQRVRDLEKVRALMDYQFGAGAGSLIPGGVRIKRSRATQRIRWLYEGREMIASVRASDHFILPHEKLAVRMKERFERPRLRVVLADDADAVEFVRGGKSVMCKFVSDVDPDLRAGDECIVVDKDDAFVRTGTLILSPMEIRDFKRGVAVRTR
ncbi:MAG: tRNA guanosine(15) transglycosylase TgtA [Candidatus Altiarchaeota archaeon]|nr:tRNA guanosine(15) transglycosylase TgtA [Candidatus Altiarchaeota archaeon]